MGVLLGPYKFVQATTAEAFFGFAFGFFFKSRLRGACVCVPEAIAVAVLMTADIVVQFFVDRCPILHALGDRVFLITELDDDW